MGQKELMARFGIIGIGFVLLASLLSFIGLDGDYLQTLPLGITGVSLQVAFFASPIIVIREIIKVCLISNR
jgi:hypothetical protein